MKDSIIVFYAPGRTFSYPGLEILVRTQLLGVQKRAELRIVVEEEETKQVKWLTIHLTLPAEKQRKTYIMASHSMLRFLSSFNSANISYKPSLPRLPGSILMGAMVILLCKAG